MTRRLTRRALATLLLGMGLSPVVGCQTWMGGMTLPSPGYLRDNPDYIPPQPAFPLERELASMQSSGAGAPIVPPPAATAPAAPPGPAAPPPPPAMP